MTDSDASSSPMSTSPAQQTYALARLDEADRKEYWAALALRRTRELSSLDTARLLRYFGSAYEAIQNITTWPQAAVPLKKAEHFLDDSWRENARSEWEAAKKLKGHIILWTDRHYPRQLKETEAAPALLYAIGDLSLLKAPCVAIVGSRKCSQAALDFADLIAEDLSKAGVTVVSGLAFGVDGRAQRSALRGSGRTIAVMACGVDVPYPAHHTELYRKVASAGLIVSEFPPGTKAHKAFFPVRNRIISGLSLGVLVVEAQEEKSGSLITARLAAEQGRNVYVPSPEALHNVYAEGTKALLMDGAFPIYRAHDLIADLAPHLKYALNSLPARSLSIPAKESSASLPARAPSSPARPALSEDENTLLEQLQDAPLCPDDILLSAQAKDESWTAPRMLATLMMLEVKGLVRRLADSRYEVRS